MKKAVFVLFSLIMFCGAQAQCVGDEANVYTFNYNTTRYAIVKENLNWVDAAACAVERNGFLCHIDTQEEQDTIFYHVNNCGIVGANTVAPDGGGASYLWIGGNDLAVEGDWMWDGDNTGTSTQFWQGTSSGSPVGGLYNNWGNEPDDFDGQDAGAIALTEWPVGSGFLGVASQWNDVDDKNSLFYIIEYDSVNSAAPASYVNNILTIPLVTVGELLYTAELTLIEGSEPFEFLLSKAEITTSSELSSATYSDEVVSIPVVTVGSSSYVVELTLTNLSPMQFILTRAVEITN